MFFNNNSQDFLVDSYYFLLENPEFQQMGFFSSRIKYETLDFDPDVYASSSGRSFLNRKDAYKDWLDRGRRAGFFYSGSKNTILKIVLKAKDEVELIEKWIDYHSSLVGYHNLIVMDCGSQSDEYLRMLDKYRSKIIILDYRFYYDFIHNTNFNAEFFRLVASSCKYLTILDADEFIFACKDDGSGNFSKKSVLEILSNSDLGVFPGVWIFNSDLDVFGSEIRWESPIPIEVSHQALERGIVSGKSIVRSDLVFDVKHLGHNMHVAEVVNHIDEKSLFKIFILHLNSLGRNIGLKRTVRHLHAKKIVPVSLSAEEDVFEYLTTDSVFIGKDVSAERYIKNYISLYLSNVSDFKSEVFENKISLLADKDSESLSGLSKSISTFDSKALLSRMKKKFNVIGG